MSQSESSHDAPASTEINRLVDVFEEALWAGTAPDIAEYLDQVDQPGDRQRLLIELIRAELEHRGESGSPVSVAAYREKFPQHAAAIRLGRLW